MSTEFTQELNQTSKTENIGYKIHININIYNKQEQNHDLDEKIHTLTDQISIKGKQQDLQFQHQIRHLKQINKATPIQDKHNRIINKL